MTATGSGKTETEARVGMVYGNFIKRLLTIAWAFTGLDRPGRVSRRCSPGSIPTARRRATPARPCSAGPSSTSWATAGAG